jgi:hypothetical protein
LSIHDGPPTTVWTGEPLPSPPEPGSAASVDGRVRARRVRRPISIVFRRLPLPAALDARRVEATMGRLLRANLDELASAAAAGADLVVTSRDRRATLAGFGLTASVVPFGYHERHAGPLTPAATGPRDIPMLLLGSRATHTRRASAVDRLQQTGTARGLRIEEGVWGPARNTLLRRARVLVDVHRIPGNFVGMRLLLGLAAGAVVVTEPMADPAPFVPGVHYVEAPLSEVLDVATLLAADDARRTALVDAGQALLRDDLAMRTSLRRVLGVGADSRS